MARMEERESGYEEQLIQRVSDRFVAALEKVGIYFDGEYVGHLTSPYVSSDIASESARRREATI